MHLWRQRTNQQTCWTSFLAHNYGIEWFPLVAMWLPHHQQFICHSNCFGSATKFNRSKDSRIASIIDRLQQQSSVSNAGQAFFTSQVIIVSRDEHLISVPLLFMTLWWSGSRITLGAELLRQAEKAKLLWQATLKNARDKVINVQCMYSKQE